MKAILKSCNLRNLSSDKKDGLIPLKETGWFCISFCVSLWFIACIMSVDKFNSRIRDIEVKHPDFFNERRIFSYYELNQDRNTENYILSFFENRPLPKNIKDEILEAYDTNFLAK